ncbi:hypothetical protein HOO65_050068 [Ceratocystis lukuohia]|uniref:Uncharacterized protein n=1 Tax=Ceratocystis lukuohia TaxID=2019550 RepID=A0ABR4MF92_9PEZI
MVTSLFGGENGISTIESQVGKPKAQGLHTPQAKLVHSANSGRPSRHTPRPQNPKCVLLYRPSIDTDAPLYASPAPAQPNYLAIQKRLLLKGKPSPPVCFNCLVFQWTPQLPPNIFQILPLSPI